MTEVHIRALEPDDYLVTHRWRQHAATWDAVVGPKRFVSSITERAWVENAIRQHEQGEVLRFAICTAGEERLIGIMGITDMDRLNRSFGVSAMVDPEFRGQGVMALARRTVYRYMFDELGMERVSARVLEDNHASRRLVEKAGYVQEGVLRKAAFKGGQFKDLILYSMLREEFYARYGGPGSAA